MGMAAVRLSDLPEVDRAPLGLEEGLYWELAVLTPQTLAAAAVAYPFPDSSLARYGPPSQAMAVMDTARAIRLRLPPDGRVAVAVSPDVSAGLVTLLFEVLAEPGPVSIAVLAQSTYPDETLPPPNKVLAGELLSYWSTGNSVMYDTRTTEVFQACPDLYYEVNRAAGVSMEPFDWCTPEMDQMIADCPNADEVLTALQTNRMASGAHRQVAVPYRLVRDSLPLHLKPTQRWGDVFPMLTPGDVMLAVP
jgi:hypothetical protein